MNAFDSDMASNLDSFLDASDNSYRMVATSSGRNVATFSAHRCGLGGRAVSSPCYSFCLPWMPFWHQGQCPRQITLGINALGRILQLWCRGSTQLPRKSDNRGAFTRFVRTSIGPPEEKMTRPICTSSRLHLYSLSIRLSARLWQLFASPPVRS